MSLENHKVTTLIPKAAWALVSPRFSPYALDLLDKSVDFVLERCEPAESVFRDQIEQDPAKRWTTGHPAIMTQLKEEAKALGLWNLFLPKSHYPENGVPLSVLEYALIAEILGRSPLGPEATNCAAPDTGNMEVLSLWATPEQREKWLKPLLNGDIRSSFVVTEPDVASSDPTNTATSITLEGDDIVINGRKWWITGAGDLRNKIHLVMGKSDVNAPAHTAQSIVLVPSNTPGIKLIRPMKCFGWDHAPTGHWEVVYENVRVPKANLVGGWGKGFEIMQSRMGPARIHLCMRAIGGANRALEAMILRATEPKKKAFGKLLAEHGTVVAGIAESRMDLDQARLLILSAALQIDLVKAKGAMKEVGMVKAAIPSIAYRIIDRAVQIHGGEGLSQDQHLAELLAGQRICRIADGPDEVHIRTVGRLELRSAAGLRERAQQTAALERAVREKAGLAAVPNVQFKYSNSMLASLSSPRPNLLPFPNMSCAMSDAGTASVTPNLSKVFQT